MVFWEEISLNRNYHYINLKEKKKKRRDLRGPVQKWQSFSFVGYFLLFSSDFFKGRMQRNNKFYFRFGGKEFALFFSLLIHWLWMHFNGGHHIPWRKNISCFYESKWSWSEPESELELLEDEQDLECFLAFSIKFLTFLVVFCCSQEGWPGLFSDLVLFWVLAHGGKV